MQVTDEMVSRFLTWKLPATFTPDCGIDFRPFHPNGVTRFEPVGTNLLNATEARQMLEHVLGGREHLASADCWCSPTVEFIDDATGTRVLLHRDMQ